MDFLYLFRGEKQLPSFPSQNKRRKGKHTHTTFVASRWDRKDPDHLVQGP